MSDTHFGSGISAVKFCYNRLGATGKEWLLLAVALYFLAAFARKPLSLISSRFKHLFLPLRVVDGKLEQTFRSGIPAFELRMLKKSKKLLRCPPCFANSLFAIAYSAYYNTST